MAADPQDPDALIRLTQGALAGGTEESAVDILAAAAERIGSDGRLWQASALLHGALHRHEETMAAYARAAALMPGDAAIAHGRAYATLEAGLDAVALFDAARLLDPASGELLLGGAAARFALGDGAGGAAMLEAILVQSPGWVGGHAGLARLRFMMGEPEAATASIERALLAWPRDHNLWQVLVTTLVQAERWAEAGEAIHRGRAAVGESAFFDFGEVVVRSETGEDDGIDALFARLAPAGDPAVAVRQVRHLLRAGRLDEVLPIVEEWAVVRGSQEMWPFAAIAWRLAGDPRREWLEGDERLVSVIDLGDRLPPLDRLAEVLRTMHMATARPLDQSVRGGTQTDGILFTRIAPEIRALRAVIVDVVAAHIAQLPPLDSTHPVLRFRRDAPVRFSGAWSVRLTDGGNHINHTHPLGWFSSALYVALPEGAVGTLKLGEPSERLGLDLPPLRTIEPRPGQLVLFPSIMWHGTKPFAEGERLTVAFDVAPPR